MTAQHLGADVQPTRERQPACCGVCAEGAAYDSAEGPAVGVGLVQQNPSAGAERDPEGRGPVPHATSSRSTLTPGWSEWVTKVETSPWVTWALAPSQHSACVMPGPTRR